MQYREIKKAVARTKEAQPQVQETVLSILQKIRQEGDRALAYYELTKKHPRPWPA